MIQRILCIATAVWIVAGSVQVILADEPAKTASKPSWQISGDLEEACSCNGPCPCWFKAPPSRMSCNGAQVVFVRKGSYGKTPLDGLAIAQFVKSPDGQTMADSLGNWNFDNVYIDEKANEDQRKALQEIAAHLFLPGAKKREFHYVAIGRKIEGGHHSITVGQAASISGHLIEGGYGGPPKIVNAPLADPTHKEFLQGVTTKLTYTGAGQNWNYENSNYMFNHFSVTSAEYDKFEADMAKKMAQAKKSGQ